jgi:putative ABC transport system substrate-binding protein
MNRRQMIAALGGAAAWPLAARAQQPEPMRRIGALVAGLTENDAEGQLRMAVFHRALQKLGWSDGRNVELFDRWSGGDAERLHAAAAELVAMKPDVIFGGNEAAVLALKRTTGSIPIVFTLVVDPVAAGLVASLAHPGGNVTGFATVEYAIAPKWVELLKEMVPATARIGVIYDPANNSAKGYVPALERSVPAGVQLLPAAVRSRAQLEEAIERLAGEPNGALVVVAGPLAVAHRDLIIILSAMHRLPLIYPYRYYTAAGGLMSYGPDPLDQYRQAASYVDRILKGEKPADLPVQFPTKYVLIINLKTAKALGIEVPSTLLARADEVIE